MSRHVGHYEQFTLDPPDKGDCRSDHGCIAVGIMLGMLVVQLLADPMWGLVSCLVGAFVRTGSRRQRLAQTAFIVGGLWASIDGLAWLAQRPSTTCFGETQQGQLIVETFPRQSSVLHGDRLTQFQGRWTGGAGCEGPFRVAVSAYRLEQPIDIGDTITGVLRLRPLASQWNAGLIPDQAISFARGLDARGTLRSIDAIVPAPPSHIAYWRFRLSQQIDVLAVADTAKALMKALLIGQGTALESEDWQLFRRLGVIHALVISGLHLSVIALFVSSLASLWRRSHCGLADRGARRAEAFFVVTVLTLYAVLSGFAVPIQRAWLMVLLAWVPRLLGYRTSPWSTLYVAVMILALLAPHTLLGASFWLSVSATAAVLWSVERLGHCNTLCQLIGLQVIVCVVLLPITLFWFGQGTVASLLSSVVIVPILTLWVIPALFVAAVVATCIPTLGPWFWEFAALPLPALLEWMTWIDRWLGARLLVTGGIPLAAVFWFGLILIAVIWSPLRVRWSIVVGCALLFASDAPRTRPAAELVVYDVGQGLSIQFSSQGRSLLFDTGAAFPQGLSQMERVVAPSMRRDNNRLDTVVLSHGDNDHSGGRDWLRASMDVEHWLGFTGEHCRPGRRWRWSDEVVFQLLNGPPSVTRKRNDRSCVLKISAYGREFLLTGDISTATEVAMVDYWRESLQADVLIVAHHGSASSTGHRWLKAVASRYAAISSGRGNAFSHPHLSVLERLAVHGVQVFDTARHGALRYAVTEQGGLSIEATRQGHYPFWLAL